MNCSLAVSSVHRVSQERILEWVAFPAPGHLPEPGTESESPALAGGFFANEPAGTLTFERTDLLTSLTSPEHEQRVTPEGPTDPYFINPREWRSGWIRIMGKGSSSGVPT